MLAMGRIIISVLSTGIAMKKAGKSFTLSIFIDNATYIRYSYSLKLLPYILELIDGLFPLSYSLYAIRLCLQADQNLASFAVLSDLSQLHS
jgi:hypothetical protein